MANTSESRFNENVVEVSDSRLSKLRIYNLVMGCLHFVSGLAMVILGNDFSIGISSLNLNGPPGTPIEEGTLQNVWDFPIAWGAASFLFLSALFHFIIFSSPGFKKYSSELRKGRNRFRWVEYSISSTLMIILICLITGVIDLAALIAVAFCNISMILFGWIMEMVNKPKDKVWWTPFWFGSIAGIGPWIAIFGYLIFNVNQEGAQGPPGFVYGILASIFVLFNCFALNQYFQYKQVKKWSDYIFGESVYIALSLIAKSILAWQIFANTLVG